VPLYTADRPEVHDIIREMRGVVEEFSDRVLIGEIYLPTERGWTAAAIQLCTVERALAGPHNRPFNR
jgi:hypothetical protein